MKQGQGCQGRCDNFSAAFSMEAKKCIPRKGKAFGKPSGTCDRFVSPCVTCHL